MNYLEYINNFQNILEKIETSNKSGELFDIDLGLKKFIEILKRTHNNNGTIYFIGNGGSAGICSHMSIDFTKNGGLRSRTFLDGPSLTCIGNDISFESIYASQVDFYCQENDTLVAISSSGNSQNIINAAKIAHQKKMALITFTGFNHDNKLRGLGEINFYLNSNSYGFVEIGHSLILHSALDIHTTYYSQ